MVARCNGLLRFLASVVATSRDYQRRLGSSGRRSPLNGGEASEIVTAYF
jgi:hypothetical protein